MTRCSEQVGSQRERSANHLPDDSPLGSANAPSIQPIQFGGRIISGNCRRPSGPDPNSRGLRFFENWVSWQYADLRVSLREMREGQRAPGALQRLEGHGVPALRLQAAVQEVFGLCLGKRRRLPGSGLRNRRRRGRRMLRRRLLRRPSPALNAAPGRSRHSSIFVSWSDGPRTRGLEAIGPPESAKTKMESGAGSRIQPPYSATVKFSSRALPPDSRAAVP